MSIIKCERCGLTFSYAPALSKHKRICDQLPPLDEIREYWQNNPNLTYGNLLSSLGIECSQSVSRTYAQRFDLPRRNRNVAFHKTCQKCNREFVTKSSYTKHLHICKRLPPFATIRQFWHDNPDVTHWSLLTRMGLRCSAKTSDIYVRQAGITDAEIAERQKRLSGNRHAVYEKRMEHDVCDRCEIRVFTTAPADIIHAPQQITGVVDDDTICGYCIEDEERLASGGKWWQHDYERRGIWGEWW